MKTMFLLAGMLFLTPLASPCLPLRPMRVQEQDVELSNVGGKTNGFKHIAESKLVSQSVNAPGMSRLTNDAEFVQTVADRLSQQLDAKPWAKVDFGALQSDKKFMANARQMFAAVVGGRDVRIIPSRIKGGTNTPQGNFMDCVAVGSDTNWCCSGTLVASNLVVTAGHCEHCWDGNYVNRVFFGNDVNGNNGLHVVLRVKIPPLLAGFGGSANNYANDISVLVLESDVLGIKPRRVATEAQINSVQMVRLVGFGSTNDAGTLGYGIKREVDVAIASTACELPDAPNKFGCNAGMELVAGKPLSNRDSCSGDSGGPAYIWGGDDWLLAGVTSRPMKVNGSNPSSPCGDGGIYTRVDRFESWLRSIPGGHWAN